MSKPPPPPGRRSRAQAPEPPEDPVKGPVAGDARHERVDEPVFNLDEPAETDDAIKEAMVRDVVEHAARVTRAAELARPMESYRARPMVLALLAIVSVTLAAYAYGTHATWVFGPRLEQLPVAQREGNVRYAMYLAAGRILAFRDSTGTGFPRTLREAGESWPGMSYHVDGAEFWLRAHADSGSSIEYHSTRDPRQFLGRAAESLRDPLP